MHSDVNTITRVSESGNIEVYFSAEDLSAWLRSEIHADVNKPILGAIADMIDVCALELLMEPIDSGSED